MPFRTAIIGDEVTLQRGLASGDRMIVKVITGSKDDPYYSGESESSGPRKWNWRAVKLSRRVGQTIATSA